MHKQEARKREHRVMDAHIYIYRKRLSPVTTARRCSSPFPGSRLQDKGMREVPRTAGRHWGESLPFFSVVGPRVSLRGVLVLLRVPLSASSQLAFARLLTITLNLGHGLGCCGGTFGYETFLALALEFVFVTIGIDNLCSFSRFSNEYQDRHV
jgi:hypothetical protein